MPLRLVEEVTPKVKQTIRSLLRLSMGEAGSRVASFILYAYISRRLGVEVLGIVALAQTVASYVTLSTDQGLRLIGARLVARDAGSARIVARQLVPKRLLLAAFSIAAGTLYALFGPLPVPARPYVLCFVLAVLPYAFSLDWLAWGLNHLGWLGGWRSGISLAFALGAVAGIHFTGNVFSSITLANALSAVLGAAFLWPVWRFFWGDASRPAQPRSAKLDSEILSELRWAPIMTLGMASILNLMFKNFDTVMLGALSTTAEVGRYSAATKVLFFVFSGYYLLMQTLYPQLSRVADDRMRFLVKRALVSVAAIGFVVAILTAALAPVILRIIYGSDLGSTRLLRILAISVPFDFCVSLLGTVFVSRGFDKLVLATAGISAVDNILMNWFLIPRMQAEGAAWATLGSYVLFLAIFLVFLFRLPKLEHLKARGNETESLAVVP